MKLSLSRSLRSTRQIPHWILEHSRGLARLSEFIPIEDVAQPVWRLPAAVRTTAIIGSIVAVVLGVRVLDAEIAGMEPLPTSQAEVAMQATLDAESEEPTALLVDQVPPGDTHSFIMVTVTGYTSSVDETDSAPNLTASLRRTRPGTLAVSRDLLRTFTPGAPYDFGDRVLIPGMGIYVVDDTMHPRWTQKADIWFADRATALRWGQRSVYLTRVEAGEPLLVEQNWHR